jgi:hypothetical protein
MKKYFLLTLIFSTFNVLFAQPNWQDDPGAYEFTATIAGGVVLSDGANLGDDGDLFAAFDASGNVRGVAVQLMPPFGPYLGQIVY